MPKPELKAKPDMEEAVRQVNELTDSEPVNGEDLLESEDLKRQLRDAKEKLRQKSQKRVKSQLALV